MIINSSKIGFGAQASGFSGIALGDHAVVTSSDSIAIGTNACISGASGLCIGVNALDTENGVNGPNVVLGFNSRATGTGTFANVLIGATSFTTGANNTIIGFGANSASNQSTMVGAGSTAGDFGISIGYNATHNNFNNCIVIGSEVRPFAANQAIIGSKNAPIYNAYFGYGSASQGSTSGVTADGSTTITPDLTESGHSGDAALVGDFVVGSTDGGTTWTGIPIGTKIVSVVAFTSTLLTQGANASTTMVAWSPGAPVSISPTSSRGSYAPDLGAPDLLVQGGQSIGQGPAGSVRLQTAFASTASGSTPNTIIDRFFVNSVPKPLTTTVTANLFDIALPTTTGTGGCVDYTIFATDGIGVQILTGNVVFAAVNQGGAYTAIASPVTATASLSTGTLMATWTLVNVNTDSVTLQVTPTTSLATTIFNITYTITNNSPQAITID